MGEKGGGGGGGRGDTENNFMQGKIAKTLCRQKGKEKNSVPILGKSCTRDRHQKG